MVITSPVIRLLVAFIFAGVSVGFAWHAYVCWMLWRFDMIPWFLFVAFGVISAGCMFVAFKTGLAKGTR